MNRQALADDLNLLLAIEVRGLANHLLEASPFLTADTYRVWQDIQRMLHDNVSHSKRLCGIAKRLDLPTQATAYRTNVAAYHYADLGYLMPQLIEEKKAQVAAYQRVIAQLGAAAQPDVGTELRTLLSNHQSQLEQLESHHRRIAGGSELAGRG